MTREEYAEYLMYWHRGNDNGEGFPVGEETDNIFRAIHRDGHRIEDAYPYHLRDDESSRHREFLAIARRPDGTEYVVCDASGPWAVELIN